MFAAGGGEAAGHRAGTAHGNGAPARAAIRSSLAPPAAPGPATNGARLSKDAYRRERRRIEADLARLGERKAALEQGLADQAVQANFIELRRLSTELADVNAALDQAEDAWLTLEERAPA
jgi:hypothetical protein